MIDSGWSRLQRRLAVTAIVGLGAGLLPLAAALAAPGTDTVAASAVSSSTRLSGFSTTAGSVRVGGELWDRVTVSPKTARSVAVQYRRAGTRAFTSAYTGTTSPLGVITLGLQAPAAGRWQFRAVVAATTHASRFVSSSRTVVASGRAVRTSISGFTTTSTTVSPGRTITDNVVISPRASRAVLIQARRPGSLSFVTQSRGTSSRAGNYRADYLPTSAGVWGFRLFVPATATARSVTSLTRIVSAADNPGADRTAPAPVTGLTVSGLTNKTATLSWANPTDADFTGAVVRRAPGDAAPASVTDGTAVTDLQTPGSSFADTGLAPDTEYSYAVFAHDGTPNYAAAAKVTLRTRVAPDVTAPGPVTDLQATAVSDTEVALSWANPSDSDFTGAVVRRATGNVAPATVTDGTAVTDLPAPRNTFTDTGLDSATEYSYAVFAHDGTPNYAAAATLTVTTEIAQTHAVLSARPLGLPLNTDNKVTVNEIFRFDASDSLAADKTTLVSGALEYGDGQTDAFTEPFGPVDFWTTEHSYTSTGKKTVTLTVTDSAGTTDTTTETVNVFEAPTATVSVTSGPAQVGVPVTFALDTSTPDGTSLQTYSLVFGGPESFHFVHDTAPPATQVVTFDRPGTYNVAFMIANDAGGYDAGTLDFVVGP
jgi:PKD domain/Fibronectin type III domain